MKMTFQTRQTYMLLNTRKISASIASALYFFIRINTLCLNFFAIQACLAQGQESASSSKIKILSWNIYMLPGIVPIQGRASRANAIGDVLMNSDYDVIVFQEAFNQKARKNIAQKLGSHFPYRVGPANHKFISFKTNSGIWILSKHPIRLVKSIIFKNRSGIDAFSRKGALLIEVEVNHQIIQVAGTHLQNSGPFWIKQNQCIEFYHRILKLVFTPNVPQIICGDFNIVKKNEEEYRLMLQSLDAQDGELSGDFNYTYDRSLNDLHVERGNQADLIDYILVRAPETTKVDHRKILSFHKQWSENNFDLSDHFAIEALFHLAISH